MLSFETRDSWKSCSVTVTVGASVETYNHSGHASAYHLIDDFTDWANDGARGWAGAALFTWSWTRAVNRGAQLSVSVSGVASATFAPNGFWQALTYMSGVTAATWTATDGADGTSCPSRGLVVSGGQGSGHWSVKRAYRFSGDGGDASANGAIRPGVPGLFGIGPAVSAVGDPSDAAAIKIATYYLSNPRRLAVYNVERKLWHELAFSDVTVEPTAPRLFSITITAAGESL
jgi:hypothetical protein